MDPNIPIMVLPGTIWSFQVLNRVLDICDNLKHQKRCSEVLFFLECRIGPPGVCREVDEGGA